MARTYACSMSQRRPISTTLPEGVWRRMGCCEGDYTVFQTRIGPDYKKHGKKGPSDPPLFVPVGLDLFRTKRKYYNISKHLRFPDLPPELSGPAGGIPPYFVLNVLLPDFPPNNPLWGGTREDGEGFSACVYFLMKPETRRALLSGEALSPSIALLKEFIARDELRDRFKAMATVLNIEQLDLGFALKRLLQEYSRPILTRPQHAFSSDGNTYFEATVDTFAFAYIGRRGWDLVKSQVKDFILDLGITIEARSDEQMPEQMLGVLHLHGLDISKAVAWNPDPEAVYAGEEPPAADLANIAAQALASDEDETDAGFLSPSEQREAEAEAAEANPSLSPASRRRRKKARVAVGNLLHRHHHHHHHHHKGGAEEQ